MINIEVRTLVDLVHKQKKYRLTEGVMLRGVAIGTSRELYIRKIYKVFDTDYVDYLIVGYNEGVLDQTVWSVLAEQLDLGHVKIDKSR